MFQSIEPADINAMQTEGHWVVIDLDVDSGATETVVGIESLQSVQTKEGPASKRGTVYEVANGERIHNLGNKEFLGVTTEGASRQIVSQVWYVNKPLLS